MGKSQEKKDDNMVGGWLRDLVKNPNREKHKKIIAERKKREKKKKKKRSRKVSKKLEIK